MKRLNAKIVSANKMSAYFLNEIFMTKKIRLMTKKISLISNPPSSLKLSLRQVLEIRAMYQLEFIYFKDLHTLQFLSLKPINSTHSMLVYTSIKICQLEPPTERTAPGKPAHAGRSLQTHQMPSSEKLTSGFELGACATKASELHGHCTVCVHFGLPRSLSNP